MNIALALRYSCRTKPITKEGLSTLVTRCLMSQAPVEDESSDEQCRHFRHLNSFLHPPALERSSVLHLDSGSCRTCLVCLCLQPSCTLQGQSLDVRA